MKNKKEILICECNSTEHQIVLLYDYDEINGKKIPMCYAHIHLNKRPFFKRIIAGLKYIFGYKSKYGGFDEFIFNPEDSEKLQKLVDFLKEGDQS